MELSDHNCREITDKNEIYDLLLAAQTHRWTFTNSTIVKHHLSSVSTELIAIDAEAETISMTRDPTDRALSSNCTKIFRAVNGGLSLLFTSKMVMKEDSPSDVGMPSVRKFNFPKLLRFSQQRTAIRINFSNLMDIPVTFFSKAEAPLQGKVVDISATGAKIRFEGNIVSKLSSSSVIVDSQLRLPNESLIKARTQVMGLIYDEELNISYVRCQFLEMRDDNSLQLQKLIIHAIKLLKRLDLPAVSQTFYAAG